MNTPITNTRTLNDSINGNPIEAASMASLVANTALSVVRDRSISSSYGFYLATLKAMGCSNGVPPLEDFFTSKTAERLKNDIERQLGKGALNLPLYSGEGDLLSQLSRLLIICNETLRREAPDIIKAADVKICALVFPSDTDKDTPIRHLRNAVLHGHFEMLVNEGDSLKSVLHLWDIKPGTSDPPKTTADYRLNIEALNTVIDILLKYVCLVYLNKIGWVFE